MGDDRARELAWQLAIHQLPTGSPLALKRESEYQDYLYFLLDTTERALVVRRLLSALFILRMGNEFESIRLQRAVLGLCRERGISLDTILKAIHSEIEFRERCWFGLGATEKVCATFHSISEQEQRRLFAKTIRSGQAAETPGGFEIACKRRWVLTFNLAAVLAFAWLMMIYLFMDGMPSKNTPLLVGFISCSIVFCGWFLAKCHGGIKEVQRCIDVANSVWKLKREV